MANMVWKELPKIDIVYNSSPFQHIDFKGTSYPKAYIVAHGDEKAMKTARNWAAWDRDKPLKIETTDNGGFTMRIAQAADSSFYSGKLSFWMCIFEKEGIEPFSAGINADLLYLLISQSTLVNGELAHGEKVLFVRCNGQLGVLHEDMLAYQEYKESVGKRDSLAKGKKTTRWEPGNIYETLTRSDVMMANLVFPLWADLVEWKPRGRTLVPMVRYKLDFDAKPKKVFGPCDSTQRKAIRILDVTLEHDDAPDKLDDFEMCLAEGLTNPQDKCPSRHCAGPAPFVTPDHEERITMAIGKICSLVLANFPSLDDQFLAKTVRLENQWIELAVLVIMLCARSPKHGIPVLGELEQQMPELRQSIRRIGRKPGSYELVHDGKTERFASVPDMIDGIASLCRNHYQSMV